MDEKSQEDVEEDEESNKDGGEYNENKSVMDFDLEFRSLETRSRQKKELIKDAKNKIKEMELGHAKELKQWKIWDDDYQNRYKAKTRKLLELQVEFQEIESQRMGEESIWDETLYKIQRHKTGKEKASNQHCYSSYVFILPVSGS